MAMRRRYAALLISMFGLALVAAQAVTDDSPDAAPLTPSRAAALDTVSANSMRGHLSFLASDLLEGRDTPSVGLDLAAEYIAAQFRRAGLEPAGNDGYFQSSVWKVIEPDPAGFRCEIRTSESTFNLTTAQITLTDRGTIALDDVPLVVLKSLDEESLKSLPADLVKDRAVVCALPTPPEANEAPPSRLAVGRLQKPIIDRLKELGAVAVVWLDPTSARGTGLARGRLIDPDSRSTSTARPASAVTRPVSLTIHDPAVRAVLETTDSASLSLHLGPPIERSVTLRNVAGLLPGSDPDLKDSYIIVSAHYDHIGVGGAVGTTDHIFNGANDDGSGTTMVIELASALAKLEPRPRRSILFLALFGEEKGLLGSRYYGRHPIYPLQKTIAMVNLEHMGRTDDSEGEQLRKASLTGFDFSDVGTVFERAGRATNVEVFKHPRNSDSFFGRSDNQALADRGVPSHTLCTSFIFPDYHGAGDHWDKVDYANMEAIARTVGLGLMMLADQSDPPRWNEENPKASRYLKAWKALHNAVPAE